ncbi:MAG: galactokinase family protein, partial [Firmicutes bacterium]|nr:galactokinase family protein [Candidatus Colimorpha enterica]
MVSEKLITYIKDGGLDPVLTRLYGSDAVAPQRERYISLVNDYRREFGDGDISLFSVPGRSEISGNHTDHQKGRVIAAAIDLDIIAAASPRTDGKVTVKSKGFDPDRTTCEKKLPAEGGFDKSVALVEGVCTALLNRGYATLGFDAVTTSN